MQIQIENGYIVGYAEVGGIANGINVPENFLNELELSKIGCYKYQNGHAILDETKWLEKTNKNNLLTIRSRRADECFPIINRGKPWYDGLTKEQTEELVEWYHAWLDAPQTGVIPNRPNWIGG